MRVSSLVKVEMAQAYVSSALCDLELAANCPTYLESYHKTGYKRYEKNALFCWLIMDRRWVS